MLTPQSTKKHELPERRKTPTSFLSDVNPLVTTMPHHIFLSYATSHLALIIKFFLNLMYSRLSCFLLSSTLELLRSPWLSLAANYFFFYPHQKPGHGSLEHSWIAHSQHLCMPECWHSMGLFVNTVQCVHGVLSIYRENVFRSSLQISSSLSLQISHPFSHRSD